MLPTSDDPFFHWFAGFADGEGCFMAAIRKDGRDSVRFAIGLRADDREILHEIQSKLGVGNVHERELPDPAAVLEIGDKVGNLLLVSIFDQYPLRAKKKHDYKLWRTLVVAKAVGARLSDFMDEVAALSAIKKFNGVAQHEAVKANDDQGQSLADPEGKKAS